MRYFKLRSTYTTLGHLKCNCRLTPWSRVYLEKLTVTHLVNVKVHKIPPLDTILKELNPVHTFITCFFYIHFNADGYKVSCGVLA
jgi:hypothetical protein